MTEPIISTDEMLERLLTTTNISRFIKRNQSHMRSQPFCTYLKELCKEKGVIAAQVIAKSGIERTYGHHIFNGDKNPSRDKAIQLAFGFGINYEEAQDMLRAAGKNALYPKIMRDAVVIFALEHKMSLDDVQTALEELKLPLIGVREKDQT